jgi:hypothetical protein
VVGRLGQGRRVGYVAVVPVRVVGIGGVEEEGRLDRGRLVAGEAAGNAREAVVPTAVVGRPLKGRICRVGGGRRFKVDFDGGLRIVKLGGTCWFLRFPSLLRSIVTRNG